MASFDPLRERYQSLWNTSLPAIRRGAVELDSILADGTPDFRRGLTLLARLGIAVTEQIMILLRQLKTIEPAQYYYAATQLHLTILSPFSATTEPERFEKALDSYRQAVATALTGIKPFEIEFTGVTVSAGAVMVQGFPQTDALGDLRSRLRSELQNRGLVEGLDTRYHLITAHVTALRFRHPLRESEGFAGALERFHERSFGTSLIQELSLVKNDWYMSPESVELVAHYPLS